MSAGGVLGPRGPGRALGALLVLLALTGCVRVATPPPGGFTDEQNIAMALDNSSQLWAGSPLSDQRPNDLQVTVVSGEEWPAAIIGCLADAGYTDYQVLGTGASAGIASTGSVSTEAEMLAETVCFSAVQIVGADRGLLNDAQLGYLYDFYRESVVPCFEISGITVASAPSRDEFIESGGAWSPSAAASVAPLTDFELGESPLYRSAPDNDLTARCTTWPPEWGTDYQPPG